MDLLKSVGAAGTAAVITVTGIHPIDVVKTRLQVSGDGSAGAARNYKALGIFGTIGIVSKEEGITAFWKGIGAAWLREASYTSLRLGLYGPIKSAMGLKKDSNFLLKFSAGSLAGAIGSTAGNPFDVLKTRMMATEGKATPHLSAAASALYKAQGIGGFYRGLQANVMRAMVLNGTKMACYDEIKGRVVASGIIPNGLPTQFVAAFGAGFFMATTVAPFDMIRTKLMNQPPDAKVYNGFLDCLFKIVAKDGPGGLYAGFIPIWARFAPTTTLQLVIFEQIKPIFGVEGSGE
eukprot:CAMPEP_0196761742 /NCGR_PEP_ID=MMETSP1095-20130614/1048_1 /TAXON_ID=96789 ORGANISM="Chromulina nebulosa, Strain UTEXLB2642" /NCGR_SAMPLE_ID=MMETSP1095 /ASSEMBLY_ACC=CAM_ASM_000446 /LENGTH=290 /DNA_ID=CAMNT_0042111669 /DNA_START=31 /DNA_END=903 /DNA_ORIENTATION=-